MLKIDPLRYHHLVRKIRAFSTNGPLVINTLALLLLIYQLGFLSGKTNLQWLNHIYLGVALINFGILIGRMLQHFLAKKKRKLLPADVLLLLLLFVFIIYEIFGHEWVENVPWYKQIDHSPGLLQATIFMLFLIDLSKSISAFDKLAWHPSLLFSASFLVMILIGTGFLLLPNASTTNITFTEAFFTATSAVCVTGLIVVDTATVYTEFGQTLILIMIQIGGLGFMTFTSFFGFFFRGSQSFQNAFALKDYVNEENASKIASTLLKIVMLTFGVEMIGAVFVYFSLDAADFASIPDRIRFSVFHAISAFCNAGFSTMSNGLYEGMVRTNYFMQMVLAGLVIVGGLGFPVFIDLESNFKVVIKSFYHRIRKTGKRFMRPQLKVHSKLALWTSGILFLLGFVAYFVFEQKNTLAGMPLGDQLATSVFGAVTPRTAGFNTVDMSMMALPTVLIYLLLMWIGASPGSTGGGLKTTTFAVAILNTLSLAKNKDRVEVFRREISNDSVRKALSVTILSQIVIGAAIIAISVLEPELSFTSIIFECFSAFSTVGLTLGITGSLGDPSKYVLIIVMFIGRVGTLTLLASFFRKYKSQQYRYPQESVFIV